ncbi:MAG: hypothetical protein GY799_12300 [Desulfobulbaceae bacterium]|nr:hypothetical protein [Desulfobulbaceae bacterium]
MGKIYGEYWKSPKKEEVSRIITTVGVNVVAGLLAKRRVRVLAWCDELKSQKIDKANYTMLEEAYLRKMDSLPEVSYNK